MNNFLHSQREGVALVTVLAFVAILTIILVAFVSQTRVEVSATSSYAASTVADALAEDALNSIILSLKREMDEGSMTDDGVGSVMLQPSSPADVLPKIDQSVPEDGTIPTLLRTSRPGPLYRSTTVESLASDVATDTGAIGGRHIKIERWNLPKFLTATQNSAAGVPHWIYVNRNGPVELTSWSQTLTEPFLAGGEPNPQFIIGRYAYRIYDTSGLLDVNVMGGAQLAGVSTTRLGRKGGLSWADTREIVGMDQIIAWRGPASDFESYVDGDGSLLGFLLTPPNLNNANRFFGREDLLVFAKENGIADDVVTQFTTFSRELNAPAWGPDVDAAQEARDMNAFIPSVKVSKVFTRRNGMLAELGEPLVNSRFPLSKIDLFQDPGANADEIRSYFGLERNSDGTWQYVHGRIADRKFNFSQGEGSGDDSPFSGGTRERLKTLQEIAAGTAGSSSLSAEGASDNAPREPNFFELLQAGILLESLGQGRRYQGNAPRGTWADRNIARHVLRVGANVIDQWDANDDPTVIARTPFANLADGMDSIDNPDPDISGVENLPYIYKIPWTFFRRFDREVTVGTDGQPIWPWVSAFYQFQLWNPHRNATDISAVRNMRIIAKGSPYVGVSGQRAGGNVNPSAEEKPAWSDEPDGEVWIGFNVGTSGQGLFSQPYTLKSDDSFVSTAADSSGQSHDEYVYAPAGYQAAILGFHAGSMKLPYTRRSPPGGGGDGTSHRELYDYRVPTEAAAARANIRQTAGTATSFQLQKLDANGNWLPVQTVPCIGRNTHSYHVRYFMPGFGDDAQKMHDNRIFYRTAYMTADPRTWRFGYPQMGVEGGVDFTTDDLLAERPMASTIFVEWLTANPGGTQWINNDLAQNRGATSFYADRGDSGPRLGDTAATNASPFFTPSERPILLNRPFKSVAEMAYASRDLPWKSLNFTGDLESPNGQNTADGALLDLFTINEEPSVRAGVINLNTASKEAIKALLLDSEILNGLMGGAETAISESEAESAANAIHAYLHGPSGQRGVIQADRALQTPADVSRVIQALSSSAFSGWSKRKKDSLVAALTRAHGARTWNLAVDIVVQTGKFPQGSTGSLERFAVAGERRWLVHLAIDRFSGEVVEQLIEVLAE